MILAPASERPRSRGAMPLPPDRQVVPGLVADGCADAATVLRRRRGAPRLTAGHPAAPWCDRRARGWRGADFCACAAPGHDNLFAAIGMQFIAGGLRVKRPVSLKAISPCGLSMGYDGAR